MQMFITTWNAISQAWGERLLAVVWQSTALTLAAALVVTLLLRRSSPAVRYWIWQIVAIKLLVMPFWSWSIPWRGPIVDKVLPDENPVVGMRPTAKGTESLVGARSPGEKRDVLEAGSLPADVAVAEKVDGSSPKIGRETANATWASWLLLAWSVLVIVQVLRLAVQRRRLSRLLRQAIPADLHLAEIVTATAAQVGIRRVPQTLITQSDCSPFVCGVWQPKLILPRGLQEKLSPAELSQVLLHELAHIRRHDLVWSWIGEIARMVYFFHPAAHWICYQARLERELACDQLAMAVSGYGPGEYAATLVQVVSHASEPSVFKSAATANLEGELS